MSKKLQPKFYLLTVGEQKMLIRALTKQGAVTHANEQLMTVGLATQDELVELTKAGVTAMDAIDPEPDLIGERSANAPPFVRAA